MFTLGAGGPAPDRLQTPGHDAGAAVRAAFDALVRASRYARSHPGSLAPLRLRPADRDLWVGALTEALAKVPGFSVTVSPSALTLGDIPLLDPADRVLAASLHDAGLRAVTLVAGGPESELLALCSLLLTDWGRDLAAFAHAVWGAELTHVHFDLAPGSVAGPPPLHLPEQSPAVPPRHNRLPGTEALERPPDAPTHRGALDPNALEAVRRLRETLAPASTFADVFPTAGTLPPDLIAYATRVRGGLDIDPAELAHALLAAMLASPSSVGTLARGLIGAAVDLMGSPTDPSPLLHTALEVIDPELTPETDIRSAALAALVPLTRDAVRRALLAAHGERETPELRAQLFSLLSLPVPADGLEPAPPLLPPWAMQIVADTELLRETDNGLGRAERVRVRLASPQPAIIALGLAMTVRVDDPRLLDSILPHATHASPEVRLAALLALRHHAGPRVRAAVMQRITDPDDSVRVEALRYGVAHRVPEMLAWVEARLQEPDLSALQEPELRALCVAFGRLGRDRCESPLADLALGRRRAGHPALVRLALHGLRASNSPSARTALQHIAEENPRLRHEAEALLMSASERSTDQAAGHQARLESAR